MYKLKQAVKRGSALAGAVGLLAGIGTSALPALASADALNPLTQRSLTLSSSSPGWSYLDGSGNTLYAPPNSGANGQKTGNSYTFRMSSTNKTIKAITFLYCTTPAGDCIAPGNDSRGSATGTATFTSGSAAVVGVGTLFTTELNVGAKIKTVGNNIYTVSAIADNTHLTLSANASATESGVAFTYSDADTSSKSDLNIVNDGSQAELTGAQWTTVSGSANHTPNPNGSQGNFVLLHADSTAGAGAETYNGGGADGAWSWANASNAEVPTKISYKNNYMQITSAAGQALSSTVGDYFKIIFYGTNANYITNPGMGAFFVRINTYSDNSTLDSTTLVDGGVTVANVMNESITIQTKVLETMDFSVGVKDPDTYNDSVLTARGLPAHGQCNTLLMADPLAPGVTDSTTYNAQPHNVLKLGDSAAEYSLKTNQAYTVDSYWRLSSNSSGGATIYYTGHTLTNTENDHINPMNDTTAGGTASIPGTEQFGLGIAQDSGSNPNNYLVDGDTYGVSDGNVATSNGDYADFIANGPSATGPDDSYAHLPRLYPVVPDPNNHYGNASAGTPKYAFNNNADTYAIPIATESTQVVNCVTAKMRYIANIAATTPAGIYTTKVNYVASPQY